MDDNYTEDHDITFNPLGFIPRLNEDAVGTVNEGQTLQALRDDVTEFLSDIDKPIIVSVEDERPEYINRSDGFFKVRNINQSITCKNFNNEFD